METMTDEQLFNRYADIGERLEAKREEMYQKYKDLHPGLDRDSVSDIHLARLCLQDINDSK